MLRSLAVDVHNQNMSVSEGMIAGSRMVFVGGLHRSGTTPLARVLGSHPAISGLHNTGVKEDEGQHLQSVYPPANTYGGPGKFALAPPAHLTEASPLVSPANAFRIATEWLPYWDPAHPLLLEKSPPDLIMGRFLQALFPGSALLVVIRHPVVVSLSTVKWRRLASRRSWRHQSLEKLVHHWFAAHQLLREDAAHLGRLHVVKYEDLLAEPDEELAGVQRFLDLEEPFASNLLRPGQSEQYEQRWDAMAHTWLGSATRRRIESRYGDLAGGFGYDISDTRQRTPWSLSR